MNMMFYRIGANEGPVLWDILRYRITTRVQALSLRFEGNPIHSNSRHRVVGTATSL